MRFTHVGAQLRAAAPQRQLVTCRMGGGGEILGGNSNNAKQGRLILPGQNGGPPPRQGGGLIIPSGSSGGGSGQLAGASDGTAVTRNFRPPPGFMNEGAQLAEPAASPDAMLAKIEAGAGHWHQLAKLFPALHAAGVDGAVVAERTGVEPKLQNLWTGAAQIYDSLKAHGAPAEVLAYYDRDGGECLLYELRFLSIQQRLSAAEYIVHRELDPRGAMILARSVKEHERRDGGKEGFSASPGDCLAYKHYRDALECRKPKEIDSCVQKGLEVAETEEARRKLSSLIEAKEAPTAGQEAATLMVLRLTRDEVGCRPVVVAGAHGSVRADAIRSAPKVSSSGVFGTFTIPPEGAAMEWVPMPAWAILSLAGRPVAISIANCSDVPVMRAHSSVKSDSGARKLQGEALLVVDASPPEPEIVPLQYYAVATAEGGVDVLDGTAAAAEGVDVVAQVLFVCRPPTRGSDAHATSELLSL